MSHTIWSKTSSLHHLRIRWAHLALERLEDRTLLSGDTLATATALSFTTLPTALVQTAHAAGFLAKADEVDLYKIHLDAGDRVTAAVSAQTSGSGLQSILRVFNAQGDPVALDDQEGGDPRLTFQAAMVGDYFVGVSASGNDNYNPIDPGQPSGNVEGPFPPPDATGADRGLYTLNLQLTANAPLQSDLAGASFRLVQQTAALGDANPITGSFTVDNRGGAAAAGFSVEIVLSTSPRFDGFSPRQVLTPTFQTEPPTILAADAAYTDHFSVQLPASAPAGFLASGPVYIGLLIVPGANDSGAYDKSGVHRGEDWEKLTIVTPAGVSVTNLSQIDAGLNTRVAGTLSAEKRVDAYPFTVSAQLGSGDLTAEVTATGGTLVPRLTLNGPDGQVLSQSDDGSIVENLQSGTYILTVSARSGAGSFQLISEFVSGSTPLEPISVGAHPKSVDLTDVNGDGIPDMLTANSGDNTVSVLLGNGDGTFQNAEIFLVGTFPDSVAVADLNGDGIPDFVTANRGGPPYYGGTVSVLLGNGDGTFQKALPYPVGTYPLAVAVADVNGDGIPDIVTANGGDTTLSVLLGNGNGTFQSNLTVPVGESPDSVAVADVNGDGRPDIVTANLFGSSVSVLLGNGDGTFQKAQIIPVGSELFSVAVADVNGDGRPDILSANRYSASVLLGNGDGTFQQARIFLGSDLDYVALADVNGDGRLDFVAANSVYNTVSVLLGNGDGAFQKALTFPVGTYPSSVIVADVNGDGSPDIVTANEDDNSVSVLLGNGEGTFQSNLTVPVGESPDSVAVADVNGDGRPDIITSNFSGTVSVLLGNGDGTFQNAQTFPVGLYSNSVAVADVNDDGRPDIVTANDGNSTVSVLLGNGDGTFQNAQTFPVGTSPDSVAVADVNGDGRPDIVTANGGDNTVSVLLGNGDGTFQKAQTFPVGSKPQSVAVADVNGDGSPDIVTANEDDNTVSVLLGNGDGTFQKAETIPVGTYPDSVAVADVNGDGSPDIVTANEDDNTVSILLGNGNGTFQKAQIIPDGTYPNSVVVADLTGDGRPDIVTCGDDTVSELLNTGKGTFQKGQSFAVGSFSRGVVVADLTGDGRPDIVTANLFDDTVNVLLNTGNGTFSPNTPLNGIGVRNTPYIADFNNDSTPDSVILDSAGNILYREGMTGTDNQFTSPTILNTTATIGENRPARDLTVLNTRTGWAVATADSSFDPTLSSTGLVYTVSLYTVAADGSVTRTTAFSTAFPPSRIAAADLTGDGLDDIVLADSLNNCVQVAFQQSDGSFSSPLTLPVGLAPSDIALADVNGDSLPDIEVSNQASGTVTVLLNDKTHSFSDMETFQAGTGPSEVSQATTGATVNSLVRSVSLAAGNFTGDGRNDLLVVNRGADSFTVLPNDGNGGFANPQTALTTSMSEGFTINDQAGPVVAGYFNGANNPLDVAILMENSDQVWIYTGDGQGHFTHTFTIAAGSTPTGLNVVRNPETGFRDLLVGNQFGDILRLQGNGNGTFQSPPPISGSRVTVDVEQVNGQPQALVANQAKNQVLVETRDSDSVAFAPSRTVASASATTPFAPSDATWYALDKNSKSPDAVVMGSASNQVQIYRFDPATNRYVQTDYPVGTDPVSVTIADINRDGIPDMLVANKGSNDVSIFFGSYDANGNWVAIAGPRLKSGGNGPIAVNMVADAKSLGGFDLAVTNGQSGTIAVLPGRGQGFFDDRAPQVISLGAAITQPPSFNSNGLGVAVTDAGQLLRFDLNDLEAGSSVVFASEGLDVLAAEELNNGEVAAALAGGTVEMLRPDANGLETAQVLTPLTGVPQNPSTLDVLETASALQVLVTSAGQDTIFVFGFEPTISGPAPQTPSLPAPAPLPDLVAEASALGESLVVVVTLAAPPLGELGVTGAFLPPAPAAVLWVGGDAELLFEQLAGGVEGPVDVETGVPDNRPGLRDVLRQLERYQPAPDPLPDGPLSRQLGPEAGEDRSGAVVLLWESPLLLPTMAEISLSPRRFDESIAGAVPVDWEVEACATRERNAMWPRPRPSLSSSRKS